MKKRTAVIGTIVLVLVVSFLSVFITLQITDYVAVQNGDSVVITKNQYQQILSIQKLEQVKEIIKNEYIEKPTEDTLMDGAVKGLVASLDDPYSTYYTKAEFKSFQEHMTGKYAGVGLVVSPGTKEDKLITVIQVFANTPAAKAGILPGDKIIKVNDIEMDGSQLEKAVSLMKGTKGEKVKITTYRKSKNEIKDIELIRDIIMINTVSSKMLQDGIGYINISSFDENTFKEYKNALTDLQKKKMKGLLIDIRSNPGGLLDIVSQVADTLLPAGKIVYTEDRNKKQEVIMSDANALGLPLVLLVNGDSASASEILAGAVQDYGVGKIVGTTTFGKGIVQTIRAFKDQTGIKLTTSRYFTPKGRSIHKIGIKPDVVVDLSAELKNDPSLIKPENDNQLKKGIDVLMGLMKK